MMQAAVCSAGKIQNETVRDLSRAVMVAWAESMVSGRASSDRKRVGLMNASIGEMKEVLADRGGRPGRGLRVPLEGLTGQLRNERIVLVWFGFP